MQQLVFGLIAHRRTWQFARAAEVVLFQLLCAANRPVFMTFFEQFEAKETARIIASPRESFSASSLNIKTCDDISHGLFARSSAAALHPSADHTVRLLA